MIKPEEYDIYCKVKHELLAEDARCFVADYLAERDDRDVFDITDDELNQYDYEYLVNAYENLEKTNVSFNETWQTVIEDYFDNVVEYD